MPRFCEQGNGHLVSTKDATFRYRFGKCWLPKDDLLHGVRDKVSGMSMNICHR
jgi:hypothetical protein